MANEISRRNVLRGVGIGALAVPAGVILAGCGSDEGSGASGGASGGTSGGTSGGASAPGSSGAGSSAGSGGSSSSPSSSAPGSGGAGSSGGSSSEGGGAEPALLKKGKKQGYLTVCIANEPPYTKQAADGTITGCAPDVFHAVCKSMGIPNIKGKVVSYDQMIPGVKAGHWDAITAGLFMNDKRCGAVEYSGPVIVSTDSFAVPKGNPKGLKKVSDIADNPDVKVVALPSSSEETALKQAGVKSSQIVSINDNRSGVQAVVNGRADAFMLPTLSLKDLQKGNDNFDITPPLPDGPKNGSGAAFDKKNDDFVQLYNKHLDKLKHSDEFGKILKKWGFDPKPALNVTTEELCKVPA